MTRRLRRLLPSLWWIVAHDRQLLSRHNVRALWKQSDVDWLDGRMLDDVTDEEWRRFREAMGDLDPSSGEA